jgi:hypothetical protein
MNILVYIGRNNAAGKRLQCKIEPLVSKNQTEICRTIDGLSRRLRQPRYNLAVAVLLATSRRDLLELFSIRDLLWDIRVILVLPDMEDDAVAKGHTLRPRFLTYADSDLSDVAAVLSNMLRNSHHDNNRR